jgi:hypothetical protein
MKNLLLLFWTLVLAPSFVLADALHNPAQSVSLAESKDLKAPSTIDPNDSLRVELRQLKTIITEQGKQIEFQKGAIDASIKKDGSNSNTPLLAALGVVIAATVGGFFAVRNQNKQAAQQRLLKAVEIIMESRSGYQAEIRRRNLLVFLDNDTKEHLEGIKDKFSGPEFTDLHVALAQAMSEKATTPTEVLDIWKCVLKEKKFYDKVEYPNISGS